MADLATHDVYHYGLVQLNIQGSADTVYGTDYNQIESKVHE